MTSAAYGVGPDSIADTAPVDCQVQAFPQGRFCQEGCLGEKLHMARPVGEGCSWIPVSSPIPNPLNAVRISESVDDAWVRRRLLDEFNIEIGSGLGDYAGKAWRIGLMGSSCTRNHVNMLLAALTDIIG